MTPRLSRTQRILLGVFAAVNAADVVVSSILFYGLDGYTEANPVFAWAVGSPLLFVGLLAGAKFGAVGLIAAMAVLANRAADGAGTMVVGTASLMSTGLFGVMLAGMA